MKWKTVKKGKPRGSSANATAAEPASRVIRRPGPNSPPTPDIAEAPPIAKADPTVPIRLETPKQDGLDQGNLRVLGSADAPPESERLRTLRKRLREVERDIEACREAERYTALSGLQKQAQQIEKQISDRTDIEKATNPSQGLENMSEEDAEAAILEACDEMADWHLRIIARYWLEKHNLKTVTG